jgi:acyl-CoA thioester hydrolase
MATGTVSIRLEVRPYELDALGHANQAVYHSYAELARVEFLRSAGGSWEEMLQAGVGPVLLESRCRYERELRGGQQIDVSCTTGFGERKTFAMDSVITLADGVVAARLDATMGVMDLGCRKLFDDPLAVLAKYCPEL